MTLPHVTTEEKRLNFRELHAAGTFVIPNPWDVGSARMLQQLGFVALASTSSGLSWSNGVPDYSVTLDEVLSHLSKICGAVDVPVSADFESGFAREPAGVADNVGRALATGIAGLSIEDTSVDARSELYELPLSVARIRAARSAIDAARANVMLVARTEILLHDPSAHRQAIDKLVAFAEAGADCLYAPGVAEREHIGAMVRAVAPKPLNVLMMRPGLSVAELTELGVRRISVGGALARVAWAAMLEAATEIRAGSFAGLGKGASGAELNAAFETFRARTPRGDPAPASAECD
jgi:2-methylisocitrate lyase-like PEP mutase family enzyme